MATDEEPLGEDAVPALPPPFPPIPDPGLLPEPAPVSPQRPWGFWATTGLGVAIAGCHLAAQSSVVVIGIAMGVFQSGNQEALSSSGWVLGVVTMLCLPVLVALCVLFAWLRRGMRVQDYLGLSWPGLRSVMVWSAALIGFSMGYDVLTSGLGKTVVPRSMMDMYESAGFVPLLWAAILIGAPVGEEFFFRGFLLPGWQQSRLGTGGAVMLVSAAWASIHVQYDLWGMGQIFLAGILLGYARVKTGSVLLCMLLHSLMNLIATIELVAFLSRAK